jgi:hypothetical protein
MIDRHSLSRRGSSTIADTAKWVNTSGEAVPAYGVVQFRTNFDAGYNQAKKPDGSPGLYFANGGVEIADTKTGESLTWNRARLVKLDGDPTVGTIVGPTAGSWAMSEGGDGFVVMHQQIDGVGAVVQVGGGSGAKDIEFVVVSMDCDVDPWELTVEVTWYTGGCDAEIPGADPETGYVVVENRCDIAKYFTPVTIVGKTGTATYRYPRNGYCQPAWRLDDICGEPECGT